MSLERGKDRVHNKVNNRKVVLHASGRRNSKTQALTAACAYPFSPLSLTLGIPCPICNVIKRNYLCRWCVHLSGMQHMGSCCARKATLFSACNQTKRQPLLLTPHYILAKTWCPLPNQLSVKSYTSCAITKGRGGAASPRENNGRYMLQTMPLRGNGN